MKEQKDQALLIYNVSEYEINTATGHAFEFQFLKIKNAE